MSGFVVKGSKSDDRDSSRLKNRLFIDIIRQSNDSLHQTKETIPNTIVTQEFRN